MNLEKPQPPEPSLVRQGAHFSARSIFGFAFGVIIFTAVLGYATYEPAEAARCVPPPPPPPDEDFVKSLEGDRVIVEKIVEKIVVADDEACQITVKTPRQTLIIECHTDTKYTVQTDEAGSISTEEL